MSRFAAVGPLLLCMICLYYTQADDSSLMMKRSLVVDGSDAEPDRYPYYAAIVRSSSDSFCGGVVVHDDILLSSAHCVFLAKDDSEDGVESIVENDNILRKLRVMINPSSLEEFVDQDDDDDGLLRITQAMLHPSFGALDSRLHRTENDLVVYRINTIVPLTASAALLKSDSSLPAPGQTVTVLGYGATSREGRDDAEVLQQSPLRVVSPARCEAWYTSLHDTNVDICAEGEGGSNACFGDSGGPLMLLGDNSMEDRLVGIVTHGPEEVIGSNATERCGDPEWPGVYTRVSAYSDWVDSAICSMSQWPPASCTEESQESSTTAFFEAFEALAVILLLAAASRLF